MSLNTESPEDYKIDNQFSYPKRKLIIEPFSSQLKLLENSHLISNQKRNTLAPSTDKDQRSSSKKYTTSHQKQQEQQHSQFMQQAIGNSQQSMHHIARQQGLRQMQQYQQQFSSMNDNFFPGTVPGATKVKNENAQNFDGNQKVYDTGNYSSYQSNTHRNSIIDANNNLSSSSSSYLYPLGVTQNSPPIFNLDDTKSSAFINQSSPMLTQGITNNLLEPSSFLSGAPGNVGSTNWKASSIWGPAANSNLSLQVPSALGRNDSDRSLAIEESNLW